MIYLIERCTGQYEDYRSVAVFYSTNKKLAEEWIKKARLAARSLDDRREVLMSKMRDLDSEIEGNIEKWHNLYDRSEKMKSKVDKGLASSDASSVAYVIVNVKELKGE